MVWWFFVLIELVVKIFMKFWGFGYIFFFVKEFFEMDEVGIYKIEGRFFVNYCDLWMVYLFVRFYCDNVGVGVSFEEFESWGGIGGVDGEN